MVNYSKQESSSGPDVQSALTNMEKKKKIRGFRAPCVNST